MSSNETIEKDRTNLYPYSQESLKNWARRRYWNIEEAILLLLGEEPNERVKASLFKVLNGPPGYYQAVEDNGGPRELSPALVDEFKEILDIAYRDELRERIDPHEFLAWAKEMGYTIPEELLKAVNEFLREEPDKEILCDQCKKSPGEKEVENKEIHSRTEKTYLNIIAMLFDVIKGKSGFQTHPDFENKTQFIYKVLEKYKGYPGISERTLQNKLIPKILEEQFEIGVQD